MKTHKKSSLTTQYVVLLGALLLLTNIVLGVVLMVHSTSTLQRLVRENMLNISNIAANIVDGNVLEAITKEDAGTPAYQEIYDQLSAFQSYADIQYIYAYRQDEYGAFSFTIDADPLTPADFGDVVASSKVTSALVSAAAGTAAVETERTEDEWGVFYSSYSPVFNSRGEVAGIIGVDFDSEWYDRQVRQHMIIIALFSALSILAGLLFIVMTNRRVRKRFDALSRDLSALSEDLEMLTEEVLTNPFHKSMEDHAATGSSVMQHLTEGGSVPDAAASPDEGDADEIETLSRRIRFMQKELHACMSYAHAQVHTDSLTGVGNTMAYSDMQENLEKQIADGTASFSVAVFDINDLKQVNDRFGHTSGDRIIRDAALSIAVVFGREHTFRIGGDEFAAVAEHCTEEDMLKLLDRVHTAAASMNSTTESNKKETASSMGDSDSFPDTDGPVLSISAGAAAYLPGQDQCFRDVFVRADSRMYEMKNRFHHRAIFHSAPSRSYASCLEREKRF